MTVADRLSRFIKFLDITDQEFENQCGISGGSASRITSKSYKRTYGKISKKYPQLNIDWLKTGEGEMLNPSPSIDMTRYDSPGDNDVYGNIVKNGSSSESQSKIDQLEKENAELRKRNETLEKDNSNLKEKLIEAQQHIIKLMESKS